MAYSKRYAGGFLDGAAGGTPIDSTFLNAVESALVSLFGVAPVTNGALVWDGTQFTAANKIGNAQIDPAAAISKSKLDFSGANGLVNADIAGAAAIDKSKINFGSGLVDADIAAAAAIALSKLADPGSGKVVTSKGAGAVSDYPPGREMAYAEFTGGAVFSTSTTFAGGLTIVTAPAFTADGTSKYRVELFVPRTWSDATAYNANISLAEGATDLGIVSAANLTGASMVHAVRFLTPTSGSHTYSAVLWASAAGKANVQSGPGGAGQLVPGFIRVTKA